MEKESFWCEGCGEPRYKCYCDEDCPHCKKKLLTCIAESETGWCESDPSPHTKELIRKALSGNNVS